MFGQQMYVVLFVVVVDFKMQVLVVGYGVGDGGDLFGVYEYVFDFGGLIGVVYLVFDVVVGVGV